MPDETKNAWIGMRATLIVAICNGFSRHQTVELLVEAEDVSSGDATSFIVTNGVHFPSHWHDQVDDSISPERRRELLELSTAE